LPLKVIIWYFTAKYCELSLDEIARFENKHPYLTASDLIMPKKLKIIAYRYFILLKVNICMGDPPEDDGFSGCVACTNAPTCPPGI
jgi:hypothetical protein